DCVEMVDPTTYIQGTTNSTAQFGYNYGPGKCGEGSLAVTGPTYWTADISLVKRFKLKGTATIDFRAELLNAFNHANFVPVTGARWSASTTGRAPRPRRIRTRARSC